MAHHAKPEPHSTHASAGQTAASARGAAAPVDPYPPYRRIYAWVFQAWLLMFIGVVCVALVFYLLSYL